MGIKRRLKDLGPIQGIIKSLKEQLERERALYGQALPELFKENEQYHLDTLRKLEHEKASTLELIYNLKEPLEIELLFARYLHRKPWKVIAAELGYSHSSMMRHHKAALTRLAEHEKR